MQAKHYWSGGEGEEQLVNLVYFTMPEMIEAAKEAVMRAWRACSDGENRKWLGAAQLCSYKNTIEDGGIELWALEGTPMRGIVIANYGRGEVMAFDSYGKRLKIRIKIEGSRKTISRI